MDDAVLSDNSSVLEEVRKVVDRFEKGGLAVRRRLASVLESSGFTKTGGRRGFVSAASTAIELGHPATSAVCLSLITTRGGLITDGQVTVVGRELCEITPGRHPFALVLCAECVEAEDNNRRALLRAISACDSLSGCMTRVSSDRVWMRLS
jgi:CO dehydrogenase/acetyl-CoA synthase beta subunit